MCLYYFMQALNITERYDIDKVLMAARNLTGIFKKSGLDEAVLEASSAQEINEIPGRVHVYFSADLDNCSPAQFEDMLLYPERISFRPGSPNEARSIYPTWEQALAGTIAGSNPRLHPAFFVYDSNAALVVDYVDRNGRSLLNSFKRSQYHADLASHFGDSLEWKAPGEINSQVPVGE